MKMMFHIRYIGRKEEKTTENYICDGGDNICYHFPICQKYLLRDKTKILNSTFLIHFYFGGSINDNATIYYR